MKVQLKSGKVKDLSHRFASKIVSKGLGRFVDGEIIEKPKSKNARKTKKVKEPKSKNARKTKKVKEPKAKKQK